MLAGSSVAAQQTLQYNLNTYNGLPSDNVYCMLRDQYGYLWIGTDRGVVKYNGYTYKIFDEQSGLSHPDVWDFFEDSRGRIWLSRITNEFGYILNDKYHKAYLPHKEQVVFYPKYIHEYKGGIKFLTQFKNLQFLYTETGDTLQGKKLVKLTRTSIDFMTADGNVYHYDSGILFSLKTHNGELQLEKRCNVVVHRGYRLLGKYVVSGAHIKTSDSITLIHVDSCNRRYLPMSRNENVYNEYRNRDKYYMLTNKHVYIFDSLVNNLFIKPFSRYLDPGQLDNNQVAYIIEDSLWGNCIATTKAGLFMSFDLPHFKKLTPKNLAKYRHVGATRNNTHYWWNTEQRILAILDSSYSLQHITLDSIKVIEQLTDYSAGQLLVLTDQVTALLSKKDLSLSPLPRRTQYYINNNLSDTFYSVIVKSDGGGRFFLPASFQGIEDMEGTLHLISRGIGYQTVRLLHDTIIHNSHTLERYKGLVYFPAFDKYIMYGDKFVTIGSGNKLTHINEQMLDAAGIKGIEQIVVDSVYGNIFIKHLKKIFVFNPYTCRLKELFGGHRAEHARILVHNGTCIMGGKGGVVFSKIKGHGRLSRPVYYPNTKALTYRNLYDIVPSGENILLNTDSGLLAVTIPGEDVFKTGSNSMHVRYTLIMNGSEGFRNISDGDTILLATGDKSLEFDLINPTGVGDLRFWSFIHGIDSAGQELNSDELQLAGILPGQYYRMVLRASDDNWLSTDINLVLYRVPTFWQTTTGRVLLLSLVIIALLFVLLFTIYYTRKIVSAGHLKRNYLLSLELKAIHAQINPHFIFNTLNTGLYFISENRNKEAYEHISSFSELLRSYIKSARNKYITLAEEMDNLENYIRLQQQRFEDKFTYSIHAENSIHTETTLIPSLLLQPFVENAIHHGLLNSDTAGHLAIKFISDNPGKEIICIIDDNGVGRARSAQINNLNPNKPDSYGNTLIADLVKLINTDGRLSIHIEYVDKTGTDTGTMVIITVKRVHHDK